MRRLIAVGVVALIAACAAPAKPVAVRGGDTCDRCRRSIQDAKLAGEIVSGNGMAYKFRTVHCLAQYLTEQKAVESGTLFVTDYKTGRMFKAERGNFVPAVIDPNTNERDFLAFSSEAEATAAAKQHSSKVVDWDVVLKSGQQERVSD